MPDLDSEYPQNHKVTPNAREQYYREFIPSRQLFQWLNHSPVPSNDFTHRELAFTFPKEDNSSETYYSRYQSFPSHEAFRKILIDKNPERFEIGPVYSVNPRDRRSVSKNIFYPVSKELVFDIDLTDYDNVRTCCSEGNICRKCWQFITIAIKVMTDALKNDFGFKHILWVYSGRRGAHAWVCDARARNLTDAQRSAIVGYLTVLGGTSGRKINTTRPWHPHISRSFETLNSRFVQTVLKTQDPWRDQERVDELLSSIREFKLREELKKMWLSNPTAASSTDKWKDIDTAYGVLVKPGTKTAPPGWRSLIELKQDIILEYSYPRLDVNVSKALIHLLKSPFSLHPSTGRICVPIDPMHPESFDPLAVPTLEQIIQERDRSVREEGLEKVVQSRVTDADRTSLKPYVSVFTKFVQELSNDELHNAKRSREDEGLDF